MSVTLSAKNVPDALAMRLRARQLFPQGTASSVTFIRSMRDGR